MKSVKRHKGKMEVCIFLEIKKFKWEHMGAGFCIVYWMVPNFAISHWTLFIPSPFNCHMLKLNVLVLKHV
jgi:hypothetical protein